MASASGSACAQMPEKPGASEDCLYLDVTAPAGGTAFARTGDPGWTRDGVHRLAPTGDERIDGLATHQCDFWGTWS
jgi:hypothetical protein